MRLINKKTGSKPTTGLPGQKNGKKKPRVRNCITVKPLQSSFEVYEEVLFCGRIAEDEFSRN